MKNLCLFVCIALVFVCCKKDEEAKMRLRDFKSVEIESIMKDSTLNGRAIEIIKDSLVVISTTDNIFYEIEYFDGSYSREIKFAIVSKESGKLGYIRSLAVTNSNVFFMNIESPAYIQNINTQSIDKHSSNYNFQKTILVDNHPKAFYDSMEFWNDQEGIAIGDPTEGCISVIITRDGGDTWTKLPCDALPKAKEGEAAFAASDTNIAIVGDKVWVATGGKASRMLYSPDKGYTWEVFDTPIVQGKETTGIYSIDFYDALNGYGIGGDYTKAADSSANKIRTQDGGKTWQLVGENKSPGYRSCVQYVPNSGGKELVTIGFKGIDYSNDSGSTWTHLSDEGFYTLRFLNDSTAYAAGRGRIAKLTFK